MSRHSIRGVGLVLAVVLAVVAAGTAIGASEFTATFHTYNGEVAQGDPLVVSGTSEETDQVVLVFVGSRGGVVATVPSVTSNDTFRETGIELDGLQRGSTTGFALANGDDRTFGDGTATGPNDEAFPTETAEDFEAFAESFQGSDLTASQIRQRIRSHSIEEAGSDDSLVDERFRITGARTTIRDVVPLARRNQTGTVPVAAGETMLVRGTTNRNPRESVIAVQIVDGPSADDFASPTAETWGTDGVWEVQVRVPAGAEPGTYRIRAGDGLGQSTISVEIVAERETPTPTEAPTTTVTTTTTTATATQTPTPPPTPTAEPAATPRPETPTPTPTRGGGSGFGVLLGLVAALAVGVLGARR